MPTYGTKDINGTSQLLTVIPCSSSNTYNGHGLAALPQLPPQILILILDKIRFPCGVPRSVGKYGLMASTSCA